MSTTQKVCSVHGAKHLFVFVGERNGADWFRCACMAEMRNAREALAPDSDFTIADVACEAEAAALLGDDAVQAAVLLRQLEASLCHDEEEPEDKPIHPSEAVAKLLRRAALCIQYYDPKSSNPADHRHAIDIRLALVALAESFERRWWHWLNPSSARQ